MYQAEALREKLEDANVKLREVANVDPLTQIYNRRFFEEFLKWNFDRASRYGTNLGCLMVDIDHFKRVNDEYGHLTGDRVLHGVAEILRNNLRSTDVIARYGGEEFVVMLPESTPHAVHFTAGKLHQAVSETSFPTDTGEISITVSIGHCTYNKVRFPEMRSPEELVDLADQHMYQAKKNNRNQIWPPEEESDP
jgi:diguanylate cyclase (GGDEF)-like protein